MDIKSGEEHVRSEARDWRERALKAQAEIQAEIERLKAELFTVRNVFHQQDAEIERLRAWKDEHSRTEGECPYCEIDDLRDALERIANPITEDDVHWINTDEIVSIAREVLERWGGNYDV